MLSLLNALSGGHIFLIVFASLIAVAVALLFGIVPMKSWLIGLFSKNYISMAKLASLRFRKINPKPIVDAFILAKRGGLTLTFAEIEAFILAGGDVNRAIAALMFAKDAHIDADFALVKSLEFEGKNSLQVLGESVNPKVIMITSIKAIAQDNIELVIDAKVGLKLNPVNCIGGLGEESISARVQKLIIANVAKCPNHKLILLTPDKLLVGLDAELDEGCQYNVVALEIARVDIGRDVGAEMLAKSTQKDIALAQVEAERKKNDAIVEAEQAKLKVEEMKAEVLEAEAEVPRALAEAVKEGRFSIMDYYKLMNLQADTAMRRAIMTKDEDDLRGED